MNGKRRSQIDVAKDAGKDICEKLAMADENVLAAIGDKTVRKVIVVPGRIINIVAN